MTLGKKIKWALLGVLGISFLLFLTLVIHIGVMVYHKAPLPFEHLQMTRVDFNRPLDSAEISLIKTGLLDQKGVKTTYYNAVDNNVVYTYDNRQNNALNIYQQFFQPANIAAKRYTVSEKDLAKGCPVMNTNSFYGKLTAIISKTIN